MPASRTPKGARRLTGMVVYFFIGYPQPSAMPIPAAGVRCERYNLKAMTPPKTEAAAHWWQTLTVLALLLAVLGVGSLAYLVVVRLTGGQTWNGLTWIAFSALPLAFVFLVVIMIRAVLRRRRL